MDIIIATGMIVLVLCLFVPIAYLAVISLKALDDIRSIATRSAMDFVQVYLAYNSAKLDVIERQAMLEFKQEEAHLKLRDKSLRMLAGE